MRISQEYNPVTRTSRLTIQFHRDNFYRTRYNNKDL